MFWVQIRIPHPIVKRKKNPKYKIFSSLVLYIYIYMYFFSFPPSNPSIIESKHGLNGVRFSYQLTDLVLKPSSFIFKIIHSWQTNHLIRKRHVVGQLKSCNNAHHSIALLHQPTTTCKLVLDLNSWKKVFIDQDWAKKNDSNVN